MAAPRNKFSKEQIEILQANRYVLDASAARVLFTGEFKERFWELYTVEKMWPVQILRELDVDPMILGAARIRGIPSRLRGSIGRTAFFWKHGVNVRRNGAKSSRWSRRSIV